MECEIDGIGKLISPIVGPLPTTKIAKPLPTIGRLSGMVCLVTGAARGIGYGIAARLGLEGAKFVAVVDLDPDCIRNACESLRALTNNNGCNYEGQAVDVCDFDAVSKAWESVAQNHGGVFFIELWGRVFHEITVEVNFL